MRSVGAMSIARSLSLRVIALQSASASSNIKTRFRLHATVAVINGVNPKEVVDSMFAWCFNKMSTNWIRLSMMATCKGPVPGGW